MTDGITRRAYRQPKDSLTLKILRGKAWISVWQACQHSICG